MDTIKSVFSNPTVVAAFLTAFALIIQNIISGGREAKREQERQKHAERMAELTQSSERKLRLETIRRERSASHAENLSDACLEVIVVFKENQSLIAHMLTSEPTNKVRYLEHFSDLIANYPITQIAISKVALLDSDLGTMGEDLLTLQNGLVTNKPKPESSEVPKPAVGPFTDLLEEFIIQARVTIQSLQNDDGTLREP